MTLNNWNEFTLQHYKIIKPRKIQLKFELYNQFGDMCLGVFVIYFEQKYGFYNDKIYINCLL